MPVSYALVLLTRAKFNVLFFYKKNVFLDYNPINFYFGFPDIVVILYCFEVTGSMRACWGFSREMYGWGSSKGSISVE